MNLLRKDSLIKFDRQLPIYNFFFPGQGRERSDHSIKAIWQEANASSRYRALYFHVPFCDTICNFCPFTRGKYSDRAVIDAYVENLFREIELKSGAVDLEAVPVTSIFFGGGTPSLLDPDQILRIGAAIKKNFDLTQLTEFSFEIEVKSLTRARAEAMRAIGVTHPRFGLQTFDPKWRDTFDLTATLEQVREATALLIEIFPFQTFDILYGMSGQDEEELVRDLSEAVAMGTTNIDIYPIDNIMTQVGLHKKLAEASMAPTSAMRKFGMNVLVDQFMRHSGFMPHNGHGYVRTAPTDEIVSAAYSFVYHEHVYGYHDRDVMGFGVNAISSTLGHVITNTASKKVYAERLAQGAFPCTISQHDTSLDFSRPLILRLPYHGHVDKRLVHWDKVHPEVLGKLEQLKEQRMVVDDGNDLTLTKLGWYWYVNTMFHLMPRDEQLATNGVIVQNLKNPGRSFTKRELLYPVIPLATA